MPSPELNASNLSNSFARILLNNRNSVIISVSLLVALSACQATEEGPPPAEVLNGCIAAAAVTGEGPTQFDYPVAIIFKRKIDRGEFAWRRTGRDSYEFQYLELDAVTNTTKRAKFELVKNGPYAGPSCGPLSYVIPSVVAFTGEKHVGAAASSIVMDLISQNLRSGDW